MIEIYLKSNTNYEMNGDITLKPISCIYNSADRIETLEHAIDDLGRWKFITYDNVLSITRNGKKKLYRIFNVVKSLYSVTAYARPLAFDLIDSVLLDVRPTGKNAQEALDIILNGTPFKGHSNISGVNTSYYVRKNIIDALIGDDENSFINRWGGEPYFENYDIYINDRLGTNNGVRIEFGYNLEEIEEDINIEEVATRIIPIGYNGIMLDGITPWIDSSNIKKYVNIKTRVINFDDIKVKETENDEDGFNTIEEARQAMIKRCNELYDGGIDKPIINYNINMINLKDTTGYENFKVLNEVNEGDTVTCYIKRLDIDVEARVVNIERDEITGELINIELGNVKNNFFNKQADMLNRVDNILSSIVDPKGNINAAMIKGFIDSTKTILKAQRDIAEKQQVRAIIFEDLVPESPTFGCVCLGTQGFEVAKKRTANGLDWDWSTAITAEGVIADKIVGNLFSSKDGSTTINMNTGEFKSKLPDGSWLIISPEKGFINQKGNSNKAYHHLSHTGEIMLDTGKNTDVTLDVPKQFIGTDWEVVGFLSDVLMPTGENAYTGYVLERFGGSARKISDTQFKVYADYASRKINIGDVLGTRGLVTIAYTITA